MTHLAVRSARVLNQPVTIAPRVCAIVAAVMLVLAATLPLWNLTMFAPQYPHGLRLDIYSHMLSGGNGGQDIKEINLLNHYIGMHDLAVEDFTEFKWMPFALGGIALLFLRAAVLGTIKELIDATVVFVYFSGFSLWSFSYRMYRYGHDLAPNAPVKVPPFTPPVFGHQRIANFDVYSYPQPGTYLLGLVVVLIAAALWSAWRNRRAAAVLAA